MPHPIRLFPFFAAFVLSWLAALSASAQTREPAPLVVMNLAAHPDDEDGSTLAYYRWAKNAVAYSVIYTRGEGGQNEAGPELYERLGAIRTRETEAAARILGTQVYFLNFYDFGFSKHAHESFAEWSRPRRGFWDTTVPPVSAEAGRDSVTARLVYLIRRLKPDVLFTNHDTTTAWPNAQHGHHQAVGISAWEAFEKAADPTYHPEQLAEAGVDLWQPQRLFLRQWGGDGTHDVAVPVSDACTPMETCADLAVRAAAQHVSQGFDKFAERFRRDTTYFVLYRSAPGAPPLPEGATDLAASLPPNPHAADAPVEYLVASGRTWTPGGGGGSYLLHFAHQGADYDDFAAAEGKRAPIAPGDTVWLYKEELTSTGQFPARWIPLRVRLTLDGLFRMVLDKPRGEEVLPVVVPPGVHPTLPEHRRQYDRFTSPMLLYRAEELESPEGWSSEIGLITRDGLLGVAIAPPVTVDLDPSPVRLVPGENVVPVEVHTYDPAAEAVEVGLAVIPEGGMTEVVYREVQPLAPGTTRATFAITLPDDIEPGRYRVAVEAVASPTSAPAEPYTVTRPAAVLPDVSVADALRVGFVRSYDRITEDALRAMGADVTALDSTALATGDLDAFDTIVLDIRAYLVRPDLRAHNDRLLDWVRRGGHLVVGYHKTFEWNPGQTSGGFFDEVVEVPEEGFAPYPLRLGRERVTYEDAPVTVLAPEHVLFRSPHAVTEADWDGWVQERGLYFPSDYDDRYAELLSMHDPGEAPLTGSLLLADVGEGTYLYSSLGWYRQLEALNPGAWRLFANLVSLPLTDGR